MELAFSLLAILLSVPALFLALYAVVILKAQEVARQIAAQGLDTFSDPIARRSMVSSEPTAGPGMYDIGQDEDDAFDEDEF